MLLDITLNRGLVGKPGSQRRVIAALGLTKFGSSVKRASTPTILGMVKKVEHLLLVKECTEDAQAGKYKATGGKSKAVNAKVKSSVNEKPAAKSQTNLKETDNRKK